MSVEEDIVTDRWAELYAAALHKGPERLAVENVLLWALLEEATDHRDRWQAAPWPPGGFDRDNAEARREQWRERRELAHADL